MKKETRIGRLRAASEEVRKVLEILEEDEAEDAAKAFHPKDADLGEELSALGDKVRHLDAALFGRLADLGGL